MRFVLFLAFFLFVFVFSSSVHSQFQYYEVNTSIDEKGISDVKIQLFFAEPTKNFRFTVFGRIENVSFNNNLGIPGCDANVGQASVINCNFIVDIKDIKIYFQTADFVKTINNKFLFSADFSVNKPIIQSLFLVKLPEGYVVVTDKTARNVIPPNPDILSDGRKIILIWRMNGVSEQDALTFQVFYEPVKAFLIPIGQYLFVSQIFITGVIVIGFSLYIYFYRIRKPGKVIFSVLDDFEKKIMNIIIANKGEVNQKRVVAETNLSKAKVSRVVKNLTDRGLIKVERLGKSNKLKIVNKKLI